MPECMHESRQDELGMRNVEGKVMRIEVRTTISKGNTSFNTPFRSCRRHFVSGANFHLFSIEKCSKHC